MKEQYFIAYLTPKGAARSQYLMKAGLGWLQQFITEEILHDYTFDCKEENERLVFRAERCSPRV